VWLVSERTLRLLSGLVVSTWIARHLGPDDFGLLAYAMALVALATPIVSMGLDGVLVRALVRDQTATRSLIGTAMAIRAAGALVAIAMTLGAAATILALPSTQSSVLTPLALATLCMMADPVDSLMQSTMRNRVSVAVRLIALVGAIGLRIHLLLSAADVVAFAWAQAAESGLVALGMATVILRTGIHPSFSWRQAASLLRLSAPLALTGLLIAAYSRLDQLLLAHLASERELGLFSAALRIAELWYFLPTAAITAAFPLLVRSGAGPTDAFRRNCQRLLDLASAGAICICTMVCVLAAPLIALLYGDGYAGSASLLAILSWSGWFVALGIASGAYATATARTSLPLIASCCGALTGLSLNLLLVPRHGSTGTALAAIAAQAAAVFGPLLLPGGRELRPLLLRCLFPFPRLAGHLRWLLDRKSGS
jgi:PST family polysaccharide transporter